MVKLELVLDHAAEEWSLTMKQTNQGIKILGLGKYLPSKDITNDDLSKIVDTNDEWITTRTGIKTRHASTFESNHYMGEQAAIQAIKNSNISVDEIDMIVVTTVTNDFSSPSMACIIANEIGCPNAIAMDINCACAGFVYGIDIARRYLMDDEIKNVLVVSSEMLTKITDYTDRATCVLFGDGAGACVVTSSSSKFSCFLGTDATGCKKLFARNIQPHNPFREKNFDDGFGESNENFLYQDGKEVYKFATKAIPYAINLACEKAGILPSDLAVIFSHQANMRILETAAKNLKVPMEKIFVNIHKHGNMSSACIPICIEEANEQGILRRGDKICIVGFGAGLTYGAAVFEW